MAQAEVSRGIGPLRPTSRHVRQSAAASRTTVSLRLASFAAVGGGVFLVGLALQWLFVALGMSPVPAFTAQLVLTILLNSELNRVLTWGDRAVGRRAFAAFVASRAATAGLAWLLFVALVQLLGVQHLLANAISVAAATGVNYVVGDRLVFRERRHADDAEPRASWRLFYGGALVVGTLVVALTWRPLDVVAGMLVVVAVSSTMLGATEYSWRTYSARPGARDAMRFPPVREVGGNRIGFTLIVPAYHEEDVIGHTLETLARQRYPRELFQVLVTLRDDDLGTILAAEGVARRHPDLIAVHVGRFGGLDNKSTQMNAVLPYVRGAYVSPIDAEDVVALDLLQHVDAAIERTGADVVQGGVQLTNLDNEVDGNWWQRLWHYATSGWFAVHNVMEYRFWFSSRMGYQAELQFVPLGGNTVFVRTELMRRIGGWNDQVLTEDAELGVKLSTEYDAKIVVAYDSELATREHTPPRIWGRGGLFRQRIRWDQGFVQVLGLGRWRRLATVTRRLMALYILGTPMLQAVNAVALPVALVTAAFVKVPELVAVLLFAPFIPMLLTVSLQLLELADFGRDFGATVRLRHYLSLVVGYAPYQLILGAAAVTAVVRELRGERSWSKTARSAEFQAHDLTLVPRGEMAA